MPRFVLLAALAASLVGTARAQDCPSGLASDRAPILSEIAGDDELARSFLADYVCAYRADALSTTADLLRALSLRDSVVSRLDSRVEGWFFSPEGERYDQAEAFYAEAEELALLPVQAEGMIFGLTTGPLMDGLVTVLAPPDLVHYLDFITAEGEGAGSEYPFSWLDPEIRMVLSGEALRRDFPASPYVGATQASFSQSLLILASLHPVVDVDAGFTQWMAGVGTSEFYPWASDDDALQAFVQAAEAEGSRYAAPFAELLRTHSQSDGKTLDVVVVGEPWATREDAEARTLAFLDAGQDVAGPMLIADEWHVVYRYYPTGDARTRAAEARADEAGLSPRTLIYTPEVY